MLYARQFAPIVQIGDIVALRNSDGFVTDNAETPFYVVTEARSGGLALGKKGTVGIWCATAAFGAPYQADTQCQAGTNLNFAIASTGSAILNNPAIFQLLTRQLMQARFLYRALPDSNGAFVATPEDFDVIVSSPAAAANWGTQRITGVMNARYQSPEPSDMLPAPVQGVSQTRTLGALPVDPFDLAYRTELFFYSNIGGAVTIINNGSGSASVGGIGLDIGAFVFNLFPVPVAAGVVNDWYLGYEVTRPAQVVLNDVTVLPSQPQTTPKATGA